MESCHVGRPDELLVRDRGEYTLTALGAQLAEQVDADDTAHAWLRRLIVETARRL